MNFPERLQNLWRFATNAGIAFATFIIVLLVAGAAFAQEGIPAPALTDDPVKAVAVTLDDLAKGRGWMAAAGFVSLLTMLLRSGVLKRLPKEGKLAFLGKAGLWLYENPIAAFSTPLVLSTLLGFFTSLGSGLPFTFQSFLNEAVKIGAGAIAVFIGIEKVKEAKNAGKLEAAGITTQQQALDELAKRVIKGDVAVPPPAPTA